MPRHKSSLFGTGSASLSLLLFGTMSSLVSKVIYMLKGPDRQGQEKLFEKPWAATFFMFVGMLLCLPLPALTSFARRKLARPRPAPPADQQQQQQEGLRRPLLERASVQSGSSSGSESTVASAAESAGEELPPGGKPPQKRYILILVPTLFDLVATILMSVGLLWTTVSVFQMMRGAEIVFSALFSVAFLRRRLNWHHMVGIAVCMVGITVVGVAGVQSGKGGVSKGVSAQQTIAGMMLVVAAEAVQAAQVVVEDHLMRGLAFEPMAVVGYEGAFGSAIMAAVVLPLLQVAPGREGAGLHEDSIETFHMLAGSTQLQAAMCLYVGTIAVYNVAGMLVTDSLGAVTRTVLETLRTLFVWLLDLLLYYGAPLGSGTQLGEPWTSASWLQALGFVVLVSGTMVYGRGEELQEEELRRFAKLRARERWARIRASLPELTAVARAARRLAPEERTPMRPPRIAGPARIRTAFLPVLFVAYTQGLTRPRWGSQSHSQIQDHVNESRHSEFGGRPIPRSRSHSPLRSQDPVAYHRRASPPVVVPHPFSHPHSLSEVVQEALDVERGHGGVAGSGPTAAAGGGQGMAAVGRLSNT